VVRSIADNYSTTVAVSGLSSDRLMVDGCEREVPLMELAIVDPKPYHHTQGGDHLQKEGD
jgi:hypothetical protein